MNTIRNFFKIDSQTKMTLNLGWVGWGWVFPKLCDFFEAVSPAFGFSQALSLSHPFFKSVFSSTCLKLCLLFSVFPKLCTNVHASMWFRFELYHISKLQKDCHIIYLAVGWWKDM